ncbi:MAG: hypothetical protein GF364_06665 [Candidatus Lokiarchaeota archaeon]|nr:hypothetical protein [Candidatus Lokiarchaeota archaeon]
MLNQLFLSLNDEISEVYFLYLVIYYILMGALIGQFILVGLDFVGKRKKFQNNKAQRVYFRGLGIFILCVAICQILYLIVAVDTLMFNNPNPIFNEDSDYDVGTLKLFRSFWFFNEDKFVITFFILFASLPFLTHPLEKYVLARKNNILTWICGVTAPLILLARFVEMNLYHWFGIEVLPAAYSSTGQDTTAYLGFAIWWMYVVFMLFLAITLLMKLYLDMGVKAPEGSKLRKKSKLICFGLIIYVIAIVTTQNASKELLDMSCQEPIWGCLTYIFGFSTPIFLFIVLLLFRKGFSRDF